MTELLRIENLRTHFFTRSSVVKAVDDVSLSIPRGGSVGLVGESGSGKSVTAFSILRLVSPPGRIIGGKIILDGAGDLLSLPEAALRKIRGKRIAMIFQEPMTSLNPVFTVGNQIEEAVALHQDLPKSQRKNRVLESLGLVKIPDPERAYRSYPHELSGGMRQRVMIAMALSCEPDLLIADEPTTALDVTIQAQVLELLKELRQKLGMALLLITHDMGVIAETVDSVAVMYAGRIIEQASTKELFRQPKHPYTRALLQALPGFETRERLQTIAGSVPDLGRLPPGCSFQERCEKVQEKCRSVLPELKEFGGGHQGRCHYPY